MKPRDDATLRVFYALLPDGSARSAADASAQALRSGCQGHWVPRENYHVTVAFVGEMPAAQLPLLIDIGRAQRATSFCLTVDTYEYWPKPEVVVAAAREIPAELQRLWSGLHGDLARHRWALEPKRLRPHLTLVQGVSRQPDFGPMTAFAWRSHEFCLMKSNSANGHSTYTVVDTWPLLDRTLET